MPTVTQGQTAGFDSIETAPALLLDQSDMRRPRAPQPAAGPPSAPSTHQPHPGIAFVTLSVGSDVGGEVCNRSLPNSQRVVTSRGGINTVASRADHEPVSWTDGIDAVTSGDGKDISWP